MGRQIGLVDDYRWNLFERKQSGIVTEKKRLSKVRIHPCPEWEEALAPYGETMKQSFTLEELLRRPKVPYLLIEKMAPALVGGAFPHALEVETDTKYAGYIERQKFLVEATAKYDGLKLPIDFNYLELIHLGKEAREKLNKIRPETLGQASRIGGVSPADISVLMVWLEQRRRAGRHLEQVAVGS